MNCHPSDYESLWQVIKLIYYNRFKDNAEAAVNLAHIIRTGQFAGLIITTKKLLPRSYLNIHWEETLPDNQVSVSRRMEAGGVFEKYGLICRLICRLNG